MLRITKAILILAVASWGALGVLGNVLDWKGMIGSVAAVASMSSFAGGSGSWRATTDPSVIALGAAFIVAFKSVATVICAAGAVRMWAARRRDATSFSEAKTLAVTGCAVAVVGLFFGWIVIGEGWFQFWRSDALRESAGETAFRYGGFIALIGIIVGQPD